MDAKKALKEVKICLPDKLILGNVYIISIRNKFDSLVCMLHKNVNVIFISEMNFLLARLKIEGFTSLCSYDRNDKGGGLLLYIRKDISSYLLQSKLQCNIESL